MARGHSWRIRPASWPTESYITVSGQSGHSRRWETCCCAVLMLCVVLLLLFWSPADNAGGDYNQNMWQSVDNINWWISNSFGPRMDGTGDTFVLGNRLYTPLMSESWLTKMNLLVGQLRSIGLVNMAIMGRPISYPVPWPTVASALNGAVNYEVSETIPRSIDLQMCASGGSPFRLSLFVSVRSRPGASPRPCISWSSSISSRALTPTSARATPTRIRISTSRFSPSTVSRRRGKLAERRTVCVCLFMLAVGDADADISLSAVSSQAVRRPT
jgi:hypothetical protein